jgi:hypothetical protein
VTQEEGRWVLLSGPTSIHRSAWKENSAKFTSTILHNILPQGPESGF